MRCGTLTSKPDFADKDAPPQQAGPAPASSGELEDAFTLAIHAAQREPGYWASYGQRALPLVSDRHSKASLCQLVNTFLLENDRLKAGRN